MKVKNQEYVYITQSQKRNGKDNHHCADVNCLVHFWHGINNQAQGACLEMKHNLAKIDTNRNTKEVAKLGASGVRRYRSPSASAHTGYIRALMPLSGTVAMINDIWVATENVSPFVSSTTGIAEKHEMKVTIDRESFISTPDRKMLKTLYHNHNVATE